MEMGVEKTLPRGRRLLGRSAGMGNAEGLQRKVFLPLPPLTVLSPFPLQLPRQPLLFSAYYVLGLRFITVDS